MGATPLSPEHPSLATAAGRLPSGHWHRMWDHCSSAKTCCCAGALSPEIVDRKRYKPVAALLVLGAVQGHDVTGAGRAQDCWVSAGRDLPQWPAVGKQWK